MNSRIPSVRRSRPVLFTACLFLLTATVSAFLAGSPAQADTFSFRITQDLSSLSGLGNHQFEFQLTDGSQSGNDTSRVRISSIALNGVQLIDSGSAIGGATGNLLSSILLRDNDATTNGLADFAQGFVVTGGTGSSLVYDLTFDSSVAETPFPDGFFYTILDGDGAEIYTYGPTGTELIAADFSSNGNGGVSVSPEAFSALETDFSYVPAPTIQFLPPIVNATAPEPGTFGFVLLGALAGFTRAIRLRGIPCCER